MFCCLFFGNFCCGQPTAAALRSRHHSSAASAWGERRAIQRMQGIRAHPQLAHDHGNIFSGREAAHSATTERSLRINACTGLHCGTTTPPIATAKGQTRHPGARNWCLEGYRIGQEKTPLAPKASGETRLWASRCGARAQRRLASAQQPPRT